MVTVVNGQAVLTAESISAMGNNSLFTRWRPIYHFQAPAGWMNDPCAAMYDPQGDLYHLHYQWHPNHVNWGNISWGHATSKDMITWTDIGGWKDDEAQSLGPGPKGSYDDLGVFSGTGQPVNLNGTTDGTLTVYYTCVSELPTGWSIPYIPGTEKQCIATSSDGGITWQKWEGNPYLSDPPEDWNITGWRDPFVQPWPELDEIIATNHLPHYYTVFGSGIRGEAPRMPIYSAHSDQLTNWTFLGSVWEPEINGSLGSLLETGTYGFNFEVSGFFSITDDDGEVFFVTNMGTEGGNVPFHQDDHWALWHFGDVSLVDDRGWKYVPTAGGAADWGILYALTSFLDVKNDNRRVQWGWAPESNNGFGITQNGYQGALALPRHLYVHKTVGVTVKNSDLDQPGNIIYRQQPNGSYTAYTLGVVPLPEVVDAIRADSEQQTFTGPYCETTMLGDAGDHYMLTATVISTNGPVGLTIAASPECDEYTHITYDPSNHTVLFDRTHSSLIEEYAATSFTGYFKPYTVAGCPEPIAWTVFVDGSLVEVYVNGRFAMTMRVYPSMLASTVFGVFVGEGVEAVVEGVEVWMGVGSVWPGRPRDSSSKLVFDTPEETGNYTWWAGN
ncbi:glycoside hydrolase family 32 protein [Patellaria atrata CBS 101060]|uniref:Glycoside hydrolase family 32 protein n=1 Tax=Patellaria atrata CBS 101060 TaxID=1346257 RepID=A0A9P4SBT2_9PEZI|nr:glycoside hydrolase family 32 protein [Patellaria atrata CBS 101060]